MPPRGALKELGRLFDAMPDPIYVIDDRRRIVYLNAACAEWASASVEELIGRECRYRSDAEPNVDRLTAIADALCPSPEAMLGRYTITEIVLPQSAGDAPSSRLAHFLPLGSATSGIATVVAWFPSAEAVAEEQAERLRKESESQRLHVLTAKVRRDAALRYALGRLLGDSPAMRRVRSQVVVAAGVGASLSIVGPAGSGRAHAARTVHYHRAASNDAGMPPAALTPLAAENLRPGLLQETICGLSREAQTSGRASTLLLTDVDRLPLDSQAELTGYFRLGDLPLRIISTSQTALESVARNNNFRADLAAYLSTLTIEIQPLASRPEDIGLLAQSFLEELNLEEHRQLAGFTPEALDRLLRHPWPGEARELCDLVAQACAAAEGPLVGVDDLPRRLALAADAARFAPPQDEAIVLDDFLADIEKQLIERAMHRARGNKTLAAKLLGLPRPRLYRRMVQLGLEVGPVVFEEMNESSEDSPPKK
ncbi:MAG: PAS domain-containing protein [Planctomycetia bacterium]|nr:PAS domain-containing protein [Planctomycetia bacterium]